MLFGVDVREAWQGRCVSIFSKDGSIEDGGDGPCSVHMWCPLRVRQTDV